MHHDNTLVLKRGEHYEFMTIVTHGQSNFRTVAGSCGSATEQHVDVGLYDIHVPVGKNGKPAAHMRSRIGPDQTMRAQVRHLLLFLG